MSFFTGPSTVFAAVAVASKETTSGKEIDASKETGDIIARIKVSFSSSSWTVFFFFL